MKICISWNILKPHLNWMWRYQEGWRKWASGVIWDLGTLICAGSPLATLLHRLWRFQGIHTILESDRPKNRDSEENGTAWETLNLKVLRIWGMLKSIRWLILISQISIARLILEIFWVQLHRLPWSKSKFSRYSWTSKWYQNWPKNRDSEENGTAWEKLMAGSQGAQDLGNAEKYRVAEPH